MNAGQRPAAASPVRLRRAPAPTLGGYASIEPVPDPRPRRTGSAPTIAHGGLAPGARQDRADPQPAADVDDDFDRDLLRRIDSADREAFRQLYLRYHTRLARFLYRILGRGGDVEDVVNDAMLVVWQRAGEFRGASRVSTWITSISRNCAFAAIRRAAIRARTDALEIRGIATATGDRTHETEACQIVNQGLARLPAEQRVALVLAYYLDRSCEEISAIQNCPVNTVKTRMFLARRKLRTYLAGASPR